jgi:hypothetical protein
VSSVCPMFVSQNNGSVAVPFAIVLLCDTSFVHQSCVDLVCDWKLIWNPFGFFAPYNVRC